MRGGRRPCDFAVPVPTRVRLLVRFISAACMSHCSLTSGGSFGRRYLSALRTCFAATGQELVGFERYMALRKSGGNHCHLNAIAVPGALGGLQAAACALSPCW